LLIENPKKLIVRLLATVTLISLGCSSPGLKQGGNTELDSAIALYINGRYEQAVETLVELTKQLEADADLRTAYLYLGRSYMSLGDYASATDAFSSGKVLGGGIEFDQHLSAAQQHLRATPRIIGTQQALTRAQLAALIDNVFGESLIGHGGAEADGLDMKHHWARTYVARMQAAGIMATLPDGKFHPDAYVTYPAFYITVVRSAGVLGIRDAAMQLQFSEGLRGVLASGSPSRARNGARLISGAEASEILKSLSKAGE
jgi:tetratricopeptide (TPR) repeat protein